jgi:hypothetical protein
MVGWTLFDAILGGDAERLLAEIDYGPAPEDEDEELEGDVVLPDYAERRQAYRRIHG